MDKSERVVLVTGVTGKQGGAVARHLLDGGWTVRGLTRRPDSRRAQELAMLGVEIVQGDLEDADSVEAAVSGVWGVFAVQTMAEAGVEGEIQQGQRLAEIARSQGVEHFVYSSVGSAQHKTGIPHFESKWQIEQTVRALRFPSYTILRPVFFMENLLSPSMLQGDVLVSPLAPTTVLQMIAVDDIGKFGALAFEQARRLNGEEIDIAGDASTMPAAAEALGQALGRQIDYVRSPMEQMRQANPDMATMFEWFEEVGYNVDIPGLEATYGIQTTKLREWARQHAQTPEGG